jgi:hypothetical protein
MRPQSIYSTAAIALILALTPQSGSAQQQTEQQQQKVEPIKAKVETDLPFAHVAGSWAGGGTLSLSNGTRERLRCRANHAVGKTGRSLSLHILCASDSYRFDLTSNVVHRRGRIYGRWNEANNGLSGTVSGRVSGGHIRAVANGNNFTAGLSIRTNGNRQSVSITPRETFISGVHIALRKR